MRTYRCVCKNPIFFDNSQCVRCSRDLGFCPACRKIGALLPPAGERATAAPCDQFTCGNADCGATLVKCLNYSTHNVCNRCVTAETAESERLCDCCRFNETVPDLTVEGNWRKWYQLEAAKRRLFYDLSTLGLPYGTTADGIEPPLTFDFKADSIPKQDFWRAVGQKEQVYTGHANGRITINIREADEVEREKLRVDMDESHRTLIGHFRHEVGHFYWEVLIRGRREDECIAVFGDHNSPTYSEALERHYKEGPPSDWATNFISAYATMHAWEDFAETWATYLDMTSALETAEYNGFGGQRDPVHADLDAMVTRYQQLGIALNEINRSLGLLDLVPEVFVPPVIEKLRFIHQLVQWGRAENGALLPPTEASSVSGEVAAVSGGSRNVA